MSHQLAWRCPPATKNAALRLTCVQRDAAKRPLLRCFPSPRRERNLRPSECRPSRERRRLGLQSLGAGVLAFLAAALCARGEPMTPVLTPDRVDLDHTMAVPGPSHGRDQAGLILAVTAARPQLGWFPPWGTAPSLARNRYIRIAFTTPLEIGTIIGGEGTVSILKPDAPFPGDVDNDTQWIEVGMAGAVANVLPPGTRTRAIRLASRLPVVPPAPSAFTCHNLLLLKERFYTPLIDGAHDSVPGNPVRPEVHRYFWDEPRPVAGIVLGLQCAPLIRINTLRDRFRGHPVTAEDRDWQKVADAQVHCSPRVIVFPDAAVTRAIQLQVLATSRVGAFSFALPLVALGDRPAPEGKRIEAPAPFAIRFDLPRDGFLALRVEDPAGRRIRNVAAEVERRKGPVEEAWDLKDETGRFVAPGEYRWKGILCDPIRLTYETTVYNGSRPAWWAPIPSGGGWLADHCAPQSASAVGDKVLVGAHLAESGHCVAALDADGNKLWGRFSFGAWMGAHELGSDGRFAYVGSLAGGSALVVFQVDPETWETRDIHQQAYSLEIPAGLTGLAGYGTRLYLAHAGQPVAWIRPALSPGNVDFDHCVPPVPEGAKPEHPAYYTEREVFLSALRAGLPHNGQVRWVGPPEKSRRADMILVFREDQPIGSVVTPNTDIKFSILKPGRPLPGAPGTGRVDSPADSGPGDEGAEDADFDDVVADKKSQDWESFPGQRLPDTPVGVIAAPEKAVTRALRMSFTGPAGGPWSPALQWLVIMKRRFRDVIPKARFASPHGAVNESGGCQFRVPGDITPSNPAILVMKWDEPKALRGIGLVGVSGNCEVDLFTGPSAVDPLQQMESDGPWKKISAVNPWKEAKEMVVCLQPDTYVDLGSVQPVQAIRIRILQGTRVSESKPSAASLTSIIAFQHLGGDPPEPPSIHQRITILDLPQDSKSPARLVRHVPAPVTGHIAVDSKGNLHAVSGKQVIRLDLSGEEAKASPVIKEGLGDPQGLAFDASDNLYVSDFESHNVKVFSPVGQLLREIGKPGGRKMGPYDPERMIQPRRLAINSRGHLWVAEMDYQPKKVSTWTLDGKLIGHKLGPTGYGGGGWMDPGDRSVIRYSGMEFRIDWKTGESRLASIIYAPGMPATVHGGRVERTIRRNGQVYVVADAGYQTSSVALVTRYDPDRAVCVPLAAAGIAGEWPDFQKPDLRAKFGKTDLGQYSFLWMDENGDGEAQVNEIQLSEKGLRLFGGYWGSRIGDDLALGFTQAVLRPVRFRPDGTPVYDLARRDPAVGNISWRTGDGRTFVIGNQFFDAKGALVWSYPDNYASVQGSHRAPRPRPPGLLVGEHGVCGHFQIGDEELFVTNGNHGDWFVFTADGFLAATIFGGPQEHGLRYWRFPEWHRGLDISGTRLDEEHFFGSITKADDGKVYAVAGHNHASVVRVEGLENMTRLEGTFTVTPKDIDAVQEFLVREEGRRRSRLPAVARAFQVARPREIDGKTDDWPAEATFVVDQTLDVVGRVVVLILAGFAYDADRLYLMVSVNNDSTPLRNSAQDPELLFKGGDAVDLQLRTAASAEKEPPGVQPGDIRVLMTIHRGKPLAMLYRYNVPGTPDEKKRRFASPWRAETVDEVRAMDGATLAWTRTDRGYVIEAALPLRELGLKLEPGVRLRGELGVLYSDDAGLTTVNRVYWSNRLNHITSDVPSEVRIHPATWGYLSCVGISETDIGTQASELLGPGKGGGPGDTTDEGVEEELQGGTDGK